MANKTFTRNVCRTGYAHKNISVSLPADATEDEIEDAILREAGNHEFSEHDADYEVVDARGGTDTRIASVLLNLMSTLARLGFGSDESINGADAVEGIAEVYEAALNDLDGTVVCPRVIYSANESATRDGAGFWNTQDGWVELEGASHFFLGESVSLPQSTGNDARLVRLSQMRPRTDT